MKHLFMMSAAMLVGSLVPTYAQDMPGAVNLPDLARGQVISGTQRGYAQRGGYRYRSRATRGGAAATCANIPQYRARYGAGDPRVRKLSRLCRQEGF